MATMGPRRPHNPRYSGPSMIRRPEINPQLAAALIAWLGDFDDGWGDRGESGEAENGGYAQKSHGDEHLDKVFDLIRIARRTFRHDPDGSRDGEPWPPAEMEHYKAIDDPIMMMVSGDVDLDDPDMAEAMEDIRQAGAKRLAESRPGEVKHLLMQLRALCGSMEDDLESTQGAPAGNAWASFDAHWKGLDRILGEFESGERYEQEMDSLPPVGDPGNPWTPDGGPHEE